MDVLRRIGLRRTPQSAPADPRQSANSAGGYAFTLDDAARLRRFLMFGVDDGTYYAAPHELARENAEVVGRMASEDPETLVAVIVEVSQRGAAPKQNPALFALAYAAAVPESSGLALAALPQVARTGTHLFLSAAYVEQFRGWGRGLRRAVGSWYTGKDADAVAFQAVRYRRREGWSHRDLLRLAHTDPTSAELKDTFDWIVRGVVGERTPALIEGFVKAQAATDAGAWAELVREYRLSWEMLPDAALGEVAVWDALLDMGVPPTALMRQLPRLTRLGMLPNLGGRTEEVTARLTDPDRLRRGQVRQRLDDARRVIDELPMAGTDCSLPMLYAIEKRLEVDTFVVYTDNETWAGTRAAPQGGGGGRRRRSASRRTGPPDPSAS